MSYSVAEAYDMLAVFFQCFENPAIASREYALRYPDRRYFSRKVLMHLARRLKETGSVLQEPTAIKRREARTEKNTINVLAYVEAFPHSSIRGMSRDLGMSTSVIQRVLKDHKLHPYHVQLHQALTPLDFDRRLEFCHWMRNMLGADANFLSKILWTDEATFTSRGKVNLHNAHYWATQNPHWMMEIDYQHQFSVNVWGGIIDGKIIMFIFEEHLNGERYLEFLTNQLPILLENVALETRRSMWFQHDGCPAHYARNVREYLNTQFPNKWIGRGGPFAWPARSPDLTVLDFYLWGTVKDLVYIDRPRTREDLIARLKNAIRSISIAEVTAAVSSTFGKINSCLENNGGHFEHLLG